MSTIKISQLPEKATMAGTEEVLINDSGTSKKFSTQRFLDVKSATETARDAALAAQTAAETAETNAETAETNAASSEATATTQATNASTSATNAATSETNAATSASSASGSATAAAASAASAAATYDTFDDRYLGNKASDPALDNDGDALVQGMLYFNTTDSMMMVYDGSSWITTSSATLSTLDVYKFTATSGQTAFTGTDDDGNTLAIKPTAEMVTLNGIVLESGADYTVTSSTLTLLAGATVSDEVNVYAFGNFELADHYSKTASDARYAQTVNHYTKTEGDARFLGLAGGTMTGDLTITDTTDDSAAGPELSLARNSTSPADGDYLGQLRFDGKSDTGTSRLYAKMTGKTSDVSNGSEDGLIETAVRKAGTLTIVARQTHSALKLINGTGLEVAGNITVTGTVDGRDVATDGTKLDGIESGANVTDTTNVVASLTAGTNVAISAGGTISSTDTNTTYSVGDGGLTEINFTSADNTKLDGIATGATANVGDITGVIAGTGMSGGGTSGTVTLTNSAPNIVQTTVSGSSGSCTGNAATATTATNQSGGTVTATTGVFSDLITGRVCTDTIVATANDTGSISIRGNTTKPASMSFHRAGAYAINFGLSTANKMEMGGWSAGAIKHTWDMSGNYTAVGNITAYSDIRVKTNIDVIPEALNKVKQLSGYTFDRTDFMPDAETGVMPETRQTGVIAQEVLKVLPEAVTTMDDGKYAVAYGNMVGLLIEAIKELSAKVEELENK